MVCYFDCTCIEPFGPELASGALNSNILTLPCDTPTLPCDTPTLPCDTPTLPCDTPTLPCDTPCLTTPDNTCTTRQLLTLPSMQTCSNSSQSEEEVIDHSIGVSSRCEWTNEDAVELVDFLIKNKSEAGDSATFKATTWNVAAKHLEKTHTRGAPKTSSLCCTKWKKVCNDNHMHIHFIYLYTSSKINTTLSPLSRISLVYPGTTILALIYNWTQRR
jgi:hypothetical protein